MTNLSGSQRRDSEFVCPFCRSGNIYELSLCVVNHRVRNWNANGTPEEYEPPEVDWESDMPHDALLGFNREKTALTFECGNCLEQFEHPKRAEGEEGKACAHFASSLAHPIARGPTPPSTISSAPVT